MHASRTQTELMGMFLAGQNPYYVIGREAAEDEIEAGYRCMDAWEMAHALSPEWVRGYREVWEEHFRRMMTGSGGHG